MTTVGARLAAFVAVDPTRPLLTWYDDGNGERVELSGATLANWVAKTANLLVNKFIARELAVLRDPQSNFLQERLEQYHTTLVQSEAALDEFRNQTGISSLDEIRRARDAQTRGRRLRTLSEVRSLAATQVARREIEAARPANGWPNTHESLPTPFGNIAIDGDDRRVGWGWQTTGTTPLLALFLTQR